MSLNIITTQEFEAFRIEVKQDLNLLKTLLEGKINPTKKWIKSGEVRELLGISAGTLQQFRDNGTIPFTRIRGTLYYSIEDVNKLLEDNKSR